MKFKVKNKKGENIANFMRRAGYHFAGQSQDKNQLAFTHSLGSGSYPRFHIYLNQNKETGEVFINLHLDQKKPVYKGARAHNAEYEGEIIEKEARRIKELLI